MEDSESFNRRKRDEREKDEDLNLRLVTLVFSWTIREQDANITRRVCFPTIVITRCYDGSEKIERRWPLSWGRADF